MRCLSTESHALSYLGQTQHKRYPWHDGQTALTFLILACIATEVSSNDWEQVRHLAEPLHKTGARRNGGPLMDGGMAEVACVLPVPIQSLISPYYSPYSSPHIVFFSQIPIRFCLFKQYEVGNL